MEMDEKLMHGFTDTTGKFRPTDNKQSSIHASDVHQERTKIKKPRTEQAIHYDNVQQKYWSGIKNKKAYVEPLVMDKLVRQEGKRVLMAHNYRLDFSVPYEFVKVTSSGSVILKDRDNDDKKKIGKVIFDDSNKNVDLAIDGHRYWVKLDDKLPTGEKLVFRNGMWVGNHS